MAKRLLLEGVRFDFVGRLEHFDDDWRALEPDLRLIHYTMKKPFQGCDEKHAPICARWHAARAAMDASQSRRLV